MPVPPSELSALRRRLRSVPLRDERRLWRELDRLRSRRDGTSTKITRQIEQAEARLRRREAVPVVLDFPADLPVSARRDDIANAIRDHQVVVVAGETGSGKTTQLPKICLELGRGRRGLIGHTQPRRLAARTVAERIAEECGSTVGGAIGYAVRFTDQVGDDTLVKVLTDGLLLAEIQRDRLLDAYDTIIIDEAHERTLNIDFLLGYLKQLLPRRPDLKVIITSATIDPLRFAAHFGDAPVVEVSGRTYPVEVRYRPVVDPDRPEAEDRDQVQSVIDAVAELGREAPGDVLVFLSGEREIRDTADALHALDLFDTEVLPLYARLSAADQHRVFAAHRGRRIVLATNVAETSLTVPGIRYVVDPGTARVSRYSHRTKVQRLPIEAISQASARQRAGRCGRVADGICIRLYSQSDYDSRPPFTEPEILRTNLASVILQMTAIGLGDIAAFPFLDEPDRRSIADGLALLTELGALDPATGKDGRTRLSAVGRSLAALPLDPRLGRMIVQADQLGCVREVMVIAAALSIQDPRERPADAEAAADQQHARFRDPTSDFLGYLNLWTYLRERQRALSSNQFRRLCRSEYIHYLRVREWQDINAQLKQAAASVGIGQSSAAADPDRIHRALLSGLLSHLGMREDTAPAKGAPTKGKARNDFLGARGSRFAVFPGSALFKKPPAWVMAAELVETTRLWGRQVARIEPEWAEELAGHLVQRSYSEPHWERRQSAAIGYERVTLYGLPIVSRRTVQYSRVDPELARELFIRHGLVEGDWESRHAFFLANQRLREDVEDLESRTRRRDLLVDDETLFAFYDTRVPADVVSGRHFDGWWRTARRSTPDLLDLRLEDLVREGAGSMTDGDYPTVWSGGDFPLSYVFEPGSAETDDGVTVDIPLLALPQADPEEFRWLVPGRREELLTELIRTLPKPVRRNLVPAPDRARAVLPRLRPGTEPLLPALARELRSQTGAAVRSEDFDPTKLPAHLQMRFRILDEHGQVVDEGRDLAALQDRLAPAAAAVVSSVSRDIEQTGLTSFPETPVPRRIEREQRGVRVTGYPALVDSASADGSVDLRVLTDPDEQSRQMWLGVRRLLVRAMPPMTTQVLRSLDQRARLAVTQAPHATFEALVADAVTAAVDELMRTSAGLPWTRAGYDELLDQVRRGLGPTVLTIVGYVIDALEERTAVELHLSALAGPPDVLDDVRHQVDALIHSGFVTEHGPHVADLARYVQAVDIRLERLPGHVDRDRRELRVVHDVLSDYRQLLSEYADPAAVPAAVREIRWMVEELRVSLFAQGLRTAYPVSEKRILRAMDDAVDPR